MFFMLNSAEHEKKFKLINIEIARMNGLFRLKSQKPVIYLAKNVKMLTIVGILTFISRINFMLISAELRMKKLQGLLSDRG